MPLNDIKLVEETCKFNKYFIISYNDDRDEGLFHEGDIQYSKNLHNLHNDLLFLLERVKIEKREKLVANLHDKEQYLIQTRNLK